MSQTYDLKNVYSENIIRDASESTSWSELIVRFARTKPRTYFLEGGNSIEQAAVLLAAASGLCSAVPLNPRWTKQECDAIRNRFDGKSDPPGVFISTSGTAGRPKIVHLKPDALMQHAMAVNEHLEVSDEDVWLACLPFYHVGGMSIVLRCALVRAGLIILPNADVESIRASLSRGVTIASLVPTTLRRLSVLSDFQIPDTVRSILLGGGPVPQDLVKCYPQVLPTYGMTETGSMVTCARPGCDEHERSSAGLPLSNAKLRIVDDSENILPSGTTGRIAIKSDDAATEYWQDENETARTFREGWIYTEDSGYLDSRGYLHVVGRRDRIIVSGGENIALDEIEAALRLLPGIRDAMCVDLEDEEWGQIVAAVIVTDREISLESLRADLDKFLAGYKLPRKLIAVREIPLLGNGKADYIGARRLFG